MSLTKVFAETLAMNTGMLEQSVADLSDAELMQRTVPAANNAIWQLGHLAVFEAMMAQIVAPDKAPKTPAHWQEAFGGKGAKIDDQRQLATKGELMDVMKRSRQLVCDWLPTATEADFAKPSPEFIRSFAPTLGHLFLLLPVHVAMHLGQIQVLRRKLGKPILF